MPQWGTGLTCAAAGFLLCLILQQVQWRIKGSGSRQQCM
jgi:hypothetical protein